MAKAQQEKIDRASGSLEEIAALLANPFFAPGGCDFGRFICCIREAAPDASAIDYQFTGALFCTYCGYVGKDPPRWFVEALGPDHNAAEEVAAGKHLRLLVDRAVQVKA